MVKICKQPSLDSISIKALLLCGGVLRLLLIIYAAFHDQWFRVRYTDIDYMIVVDGARNMWTGGSPFDRTTYRYTPLLAALVLPSVWFAHPMGKIIFALCDLGAAYYCYSALITFATERSARRVVMLFILFNPIVLSVSTRGNSDMLVTFMNLMVLCKFTRGNVYQAAAVLGFAVHFKLYPVIYILPLVLGVWEQSLSRKVPVWKRAVDTGRTVIACGVTAVVSFMVPTTLCYLIYGQRYIDEAFLYHVQREDHRHNFSPYWLLMYLNMAQQHLGWGANMAPGIIAFVPQALVLIFVSYKLRRNVAHACCVETILFIAFNKVCTVQYFVWFIPFLAFLFCQPRWLSECELQGDASAVFPVLKTALVVLVWAGTIPLWVSTAVPLEFHGHSDFAKLWLVSCLFFLSMVALASFVTCVAYRIQRLEGTRKAIKSA